MSPLTTLALLALTGVCSCGTLDCSYLELLTYLNLTTTNSALVNMRPVKNWMTPTLVRVDMLLFGILEVNEKTQTFTSHIWMSMLWTNEFLTWNKSDFCGIDKLMVPRSTQWIPDVVIAEDVSDSGTIQSVPVVSLSPEGSQVAVTRQRLTATCLLVVTLFPFDQQRCNFTFTFINSDEASIQLGSIHNETELSKTSEHFMVTQGEWDLNKMEIFQYRNRTSGYPDRLVYTVTISRRPLLYVVIFILPLLLFVWLDVASFFINEARGEKLSFKVTVLLSISVLLLILKDMMPSTENRLPMIAIYCLGIFCLVGFSVLEAMLLSFLHDLDGYCKPQSPDNSQEEIQLDEDFGQAEEAPDKGPAPLDQGRDLLKLILEKVRTARQEVAERCKEEMRPGRYRRLADIIDRVFFSLYLLTASVFLTYMYIVWISHVF
ncbi:5-hydroxytryptamine receptor 3A-like [Pungitius pungitius]|uniref:5-hydroxytryptamine receptor 3A-like n=1 Tax=Pungitius pungitius TaxID=134920 RepID=UPI002E0D5250